MDDLMLHLAQEAGIALQQHSQLPICIRQGICQFGSQWQAALPILLGTLRKRSSSTPPKTLILSRLGTR